MVQKDFLEMMECDHGAKRMLGKDNTHFVDD
jgi:hypothetical protein